MTSSTKKKILLVEDSSDHAFLIKRAIISEFHDLEIEWVQDGEEAIEVIIGAKNHPDLIILDIKMPRMNGFDVLRILKTNQETSHIPVVILSTSENDNDITLAYSLYANSYVTKPIEITEFRSKLKSIPKYWLFTNRMS
ncbi:MAG: response regulator [Candidatus Hodarchaeales archaeon]|jgi:CheY-like chemotaxis protein